MIASLLLALGQFGLASAASWSDRSGDGSAGTSFVNTDRDGGKGTVASATPLGLASPVTSTMIDKFEGLVAGTTDTWTAGNLCQGGSNPCYKELENVPHRVTFKNLTPGTEYSVDVLIDFRDNAGHPGYANINSVSAESGVSGSVSVAFNGTTTTGCGSATTCRSYTFTFTANDDKAEIRFNAKLAIGAHLFGGASLSARLTAAAKNVPLPVKDILLDIRAHKFNDLNGDGDQDEGEPDLAGWQMTLYPGTDCSGQPVDVTDNEGTDPNPGTTDAAGNVDWTNLSASDGDQDGNFSVLETLQSGWINTTTLCRIVGIVSQANVATFGNRQLEPNLEISKTGPDSVELGGEVTYEITVRNTGEGATPESVTITDAIPSQLSDVSATYSKNEGDPQDCSVDGNDVTCEVGVLEPGDTVVVTITATAPEGSCPTLENQAFVGELGSGIVTTEVTGCAPNLEISKTGPESVETGGTVTYSITVANTGTAPTEGDVVVTDQVPPELSDVHAVFSVGGEDVQDCEVDGNAVSCNVGVLDPGEEVLITITATAPEGSCPTLENQAFVGELGSGTVTTEVTGCQPPPPPAGIQIVKDGPALAHVGDTVTYTLDVSLTLDSTALTDVTVTDPICDAGTLSTATGDDGDGVLEQGETWRYTCTHVVTEGDPDPLPNTATVTGTAGDTTVSDQDSHEVDLIHPAIRIVKSASPTSGSPGDDITYTYEVTNTGDVTLTDISVDDDKLGHICDIASLEPTASATCTASFQIPAQAGASTIRNVGAAVGEDPLGETVRDEDDASITVVLGGTVTPPTPTPTKTPPGGTAFTGAAAAVPLSFLALLLLTLGSGLLWIGGRRGRRLTER